MSKSQKIIFGIIVGTIVVILIIGSVFLMLQKPGVSGERGGDVDKYAVNSNGDVGNPSALDHMIRPFLSGGVHGDGGGG